MEPLNTRNPNLEKNDWEKLAEHCSAQSIAALEQSMFSLETGQPPTPSFKLYGRSDVSLVTDFLASLRKCRDSYPKWMLDYEDSRVEKFGPQGGHAPWSELEDDFLLYKSNPKDMRSISQRVLNDQKRCYRDLRCSMLSIRDALSTLKQEGKILERAAGWNTFQLKKTDPEAQQEACRLARDGNWKSGVGYVFSRYNKLKKRLFMPMPYSLMIKQAQYFVPFLHGIQDSLRRSGYRSPYVFWADKVGFDNCFQIVSDLINTNDRGRGDLLFIQRDFEKMDTTTASSQYSNVFIPILLSAYHYSKLPDMEECMLATTTMPIISPTGTMTGNHGTASGAEVTNGGETVLNDYYERLTREIYYAGKHNYETQFLSSQGNGDDGMTIVRSTNIDQFKIDYAAAANQAAEECGLRVSAEKWRMDSEFGLYCQNMYWYDNRRIQWAYPAALILNSIINPERQYTPSQWDKDYRDLDIIQKLDNGRGLPYYHKLIDYVMKGTKYPLLGRDEAETTRILSKYDKYRSLQSLGEAYNRQDWSPSNSPTIRYILSKR